MISILAIHWFPFFGGYNKLWKAVFHVIINICKIWVSWPQYECTGVNMLPFGCESGLCMFILRGNFYFVAMKLTSAMYK